MNRIENSNGTSTEKKTQHKLGQIQFFKLCEYLKANAERFTKERPTLDSVAQQATATLGFVVTKRPVSQAKEATGIEWKIAPHRGNDGRARAERSKIRRKAILSIGPAVAGLYKDCGGNPPDYLVASVAELEELDGDD